jgi:hypothetical protein
MDCSGNRPPFTDRGQWILLNVVQAASAVKEEALIHSEHRVLMLPFVVFVCVKCITLYLVSACFSL